MAKKKILWLLLTLTACTAFSQGEDFRPIILIKDSISYLCFDSSNATKLAIRIVELQEQKEINLMHIQKIIALETAVKNEKDISENLTSEVKNYKDILDEQKKQLGLSDEQIKRLKKEVRRQKVQKFLIVGGVVVVAVLGLLY